MHQWPLNRIVKSLSPILVVVELLLCGRLFVIFSLSRRPAANIPPLTYHGNSSSAESFSAKELNWFLSIATVNFHELLSEIFCKNRLKSLALCLSNCLVLNFCMLAVTLLLQAASR